MKFKKTYLNRLLSRFNRSWFFVVLLLMLSIVCWLLVPFIIGEISIKIIVAICIIMILLPVFPFLSTSFRKWRKQLFIEQLNETVPNLNYCARLFFKDENSLNLLEQLQVKKSMELISAYNSSIQFKNNLPIMLSFFLLNLVSVLAIINYQSTNKNSVGNIEIIEIDNKQNIVVKEEPDTLKLLKQNINIQPPAYTNLKNFTQKKLNISAPEESKISWQYEFNRTPSALISLQMESKNITFKTNDDINYTLSLKPKNNSIYSIQLNDSIAASSINAVGEIKLIKDQATVIKIFDSKAYKSLDINEIDKLNLNYTLSDDYGISKAETHLILSSGKGESVKFVEDYILLEGIGNNRSYKKNIDLKKYVPQPGDEFYIRIKATDNKPVIPNVSYSSTYIIAIKDTAKTMATFEMALGMDIEPEYFRSQRQLIIDTEKLLEKKAELITIAFKEQSNNIGIEQKILRLRYGKFLGEEFEGEIGVRKETEKQTLAKGTSENKNTDSDKKNVHLHDKESKHDHNLTEKNHQHSESCEHKHPHESVVEADPDHKHEHNEDHQHSEDCEHDLTENIEEKESEIQHQHAGHEHEHGHNHDDSNTNDDPEQTENLLAPFMHFHDSGEINTFFESEVKAKLKAALAEMWQSELQLRIGNPKLSLPYQNTALKLIKEVQQASRIYVERVGIKLSKIPVAKKRLTGELDDVENIERQNNFPNVFDDTALKNSVSQFNKLNIEEFNLPLNIEVLNNLTQQLYAASKHQPITAAKAIHLIQQLNINIRNKKYSYLKLKQYLNELVIDIEGEKSGKKTTTNTRLNNLFRQYLYN